jgi:hypothetical protein
MSGAPRPASWGSSSVYMPDPVVEIIKAAGHQADQRVRESSVLAAAVHEQRYQGGRADGPLVNRSTFLWALGHDDDTVRAALEENGVEIDTLGTALGITGDYRPPTEPYALADELTRALQTFVKRAGKRQLVVTPWALAAAVLEDIAAYGGIAGERLGRFGTSAEAILATLRRLRTEGFGQNDSRASPAPLMRDVTPRQFGVQLPNGAEPRPYVRRDIDGELDRQLREQLPVVAVVAPAVSGAIRSVYEALLRQRPNDRVLLLHEWLKGRAGDQQPRPEEFEKLLTSGADVVWVRNLGELTLLHPVLVDWFRSRGEAIAATIVLVVRPDDVEQAAALGLMPDPPLEMTGGLSADEQERAKGLYEGDVTQVGSIASATIRRHGVRRANYASDSATALLLDDTSDDLDIRTDVDMIAKLIASKDVHPPLSIGLFGPWGSGKSFLMRQVQLRIKDLADQSRGRKEDETGYHSEIVPVEFNAWQYAHGEALWASLINRVFEGVRVQLGNDSRYQQVLKDIADKDLGVAQARAKVVEAESAVAKTLPAAEDRVIDKVAKDHGMSEASTKQIKEGLDLDVATRQVSDLKKEYDRLMTARSRVGKGWSAAATWRKALIAGLVVVGAVALALYVSAPEAFGQLVALATGALSLVGAATQVLRPVNQGLEQAAKVLRADDADKQKLQEAQDELARATHKLTAAKTNGLAGLYGFVSERSSAAEYRQQLGMAPMIRDDLERLATKSREDEGLPGIDRIVIYIDDLDRCPPREVVRVLEAVNLLFGFELFVVVVAVDSRWLIQSLLSNFNEAFASRDGSAPTPQNYLEKIIQIPFWLQPMQPIGFGRLVTSLAGEVDDRRVEGDDRRAEGELREVSIAGVPSTSGDGDVWGGRTADVEDFGLVPSGQPPSTEKQSAPVEPVVTGEVSEDERAEDLNPAALRLTAEERDFMTGFLPLVDTPRAVKRFLNTYQLLRVSVDDVDDFLARREYEPVLVLLALMTGTVGLTDERVLELASMTETDFAKFLFPLYEVAGEDERRPREGWHEVVSACDKLPTETLTPAVIRDWLPRVARYSFHHVDA